MSENILQENIKSFYKRYPFYEKKWRTFNLEDVFKGLEVKEEEGFIQLIERGEVCDTSDISQFPDLVKSDHAIRLAFLEGFGLGTNLQHLIQNRPPELKRVVIIEPTVERFLFSLSLTNFSNLFEQEFIEWIVGLSPEEIFAMFVSQNMEVKHSIFMKAYQFIPHPQYSKRYAGYFEQVRDEFKAATHYITNAWGGQDDSVQGFRQLCENQEFIENTPGILNLKEAFKGLPAIICSTGPSLSKSLEDIKKNQERAVIFCADSAFKVLLENGIQPHFVASLERGPLLHRFYEGVSFEEPEQATHMVTFPFVDSQTLSSYAGPKWVAYRNYGYFQFLNAKCPKGVISSAGSVSHMCLRLADYMGCSQVALVGQDLSYDPKSFQSHANGVAYHEWSEAQSIEALQKKIKKRGLGDIIWVYGNKEKEVPTDTVYFSFMKEFSWETTALSMEIINCTEGGARIPNMMWQSLSQLSADWQPLSENIFEQLKTLHLKNDFHPIDWKVIVDFLQNLDSKMAQTDSTLNEIAAFKETNPDMVKEGVKAIRLAHSQLLQQDIFLNFVVQNIGRQILELENKWNALYDEDDTNLDLRLGLIKDWSKQVRSVSKDLLEILR